MTNCFIINSLRQSIEMFNHVNDVHHPLISFFLDQKEKNKCQAEWHEDKVYQVSSDSQ